VKCVLARESLSAWVDGEEAVARSLDVSRHLASCRDCTAYAERLGALTDLTRALQVADAPTSTAESGQPAQTAQTGVVSPRLLGLRLGVAVLSLLELAAVLADLVGEHGYGGEDHAGHESLSLTLAFCAGLLWVAWRPAYARGYLPLVGVAAVLLGATATVDVVRGGANVFDELPHVGFLVGFVLLWLLSHQGSGRSQPRVWARLLATPADRGRLRLVRGAMRAIAGPVDEYAATLPLPFR
jgi:predicted anti-sigma-YlaC factor YlaD